MARGENNVAEQSESGFDQMVSEKAAYQDAQAVGSMPYPIPGRLAGIGAYQRPYSIEMPVSRLVTGKGTGNISAWVSKEIGAYCSKLPEGARVRLMIDPNS